MLEVRSWPESANKCEVVTHPVMMISEVTTLKSGVMTLKVLTRTGQGPLVRGQGPPHPTPKRVRALSQCWGRPPSWQRCPWRGGGGNDLPGVPHPTMAQCCVRNFGLETWTCWGESAGTGVSPHALCPTAVGLGGGTHRCRRVRGGKVDPKVVLKLGVCWDEGVQQGCSGWGWEGYKPALPTPWGHQGPPPPSTHLGSGR